MFPAGGYTGEKVPFMLTFAEVLRSPRQLGPIMRIPASRTMSSNSRSRAAPSAPISEKPAEMTTIPRTPAETQSRATSSTCSAGTTMKARSTSSGTSDTRG